MRFSNKTNRFRILLILCLWYIFKNILIINFIKDFCLYIYKYKFNNYLGGKISFQLSQYHAIIGSSVTFEITPK